jgi:hypothetical protein
MTGKHTIHIQVKESGNKVAFSENTEQVDVYDCIPFRSNVAPYPLNKYGNLFKGYKKNDNDFYGNHSCCLGDLNNIKVGNENTVCFNTVDYGCLGHFIDTNSDEYNYLPGVSNTPDVKKPAPKEKDSNIYKRVITRRCDGTRGNICNGTYSIELFYETSCPKGMKCMYREKILDINQICSPI